MPPVEGAGPAAPGKSTMSTKPRPGRKWRSMSASETRLKGDISSSPSKTGRRDSVSHHREPGRVTVLELVHAQSVVARSDAGWLDDMSLSLLTISTCCTPSFPVRRRPPVRSMPLTPVHVPDLERVTRWLPSTYSRISRPPAIGHYAAVMTAPRTRFCAGSSPERFPSAPHANPTPVLSLPATRDTVASSASAMPLESDWAQLGCMRADAKA